MSNETTLDDVLALVGKWRSLALDRDNGLDDYYKQALDACADELEDHGPAIKAALAGWQPIETAPEDEDVLTWHDFGMRVQNPNHPDYGKVGKPIIQQRLPGGAFPSDITGTGRVTHWKSCDQPDPTP